MPHKDAICIYCKAKMEIGKVHPSLTTYHGECRLDAMREQWAKATCDLERDILRAEADAIKNHMKGLSHG